MGIVFALVIYFLRIHKVDRSTHIVFQIKLLGVINYLIALAAKIVTHEINYENARWRLNRSRLGRVYFFLAA